MFDTRRKMVWGIAGLALVAVLAVGGYVWFRETADPYEGLTVWRETQMDDATRELLQQRMAVTQASIAAEEAEDGEADTNLYISLANDAYVLGDLVMARELIEEVLNRDPLRYTVWNTYGNVLAQMGDITLAEDAYLEAIEIQPLVEYYMDLVTLLQVHYPERDDDVLRTLEHGVATLGQQTEFMVALGDWYAAHGECQAAEDHYKVAMTLSPESTSIAEDYRDVRATCVNAE